MRISTEAKVGLLVLIGILLLVYMTFTVGEFNIGREKGYKIYAIFDSAGGLELKAPVRMAGVEIGKVENIELIGEEAKVTLRINEGIKLKKGVEAVVRSTGLLGEKYVEILPATADKSNPGNTTYLKEKDTIGQRGKTTDIDQLLSQLTGVAEDIKAVTASLREALGTTEGKESIKEIVANLRDSTKNMSKILKDNQETLSKAIRNFEELSTSLKSVASRLDKGEGTIGKLLKEDKTINELNSALESVKNIAKKIEQGEGTLGKMLTEDETINRLNSALEGIDSIAKKIEKGEGTIGKLMTEDSTVNNLNSALAGLSNYVNRLEKLKTIFNFRAEYLLADEKSKGYFGLQIEPRPDKYYIIEVVDDPFGREIVTETTRTVDGTTQNIKEIKKERELEFTVHFAKRYGDIALRIGMTENTFGVGTDYFLLKDDLRFSLDAWDFNRDEADSSNVHLKGTASYIFFKNFFVTGGYDDILEGKKSNAFVGAGFRFDDEDLKYIMGRLPIP